MFKSLRNTILGAVAGTAAIVAVAAPSAGQQLQIGAVMYARDSQYWQQIENGMKDAAAQHKVGLQVALSRRQLPTESQVVEDLITRKVDVIVISPLDKDGSAAALSRAKSQGIPIVEYNTFLADKSIAIHNIGVDNSELAAAVGREMRRAIDKDLGGSATVGLITLPPINPGMTVRKGGVLSSLEGAKYTIVAEAAAATPEEGANALENILQKNPATQLIWASSAGSIAGAATAAKRANAKAKLFGIDMSQELAEMLLDPASTLEAVSDQQPYWMGFLAVETAVKAKQGQSMPREILLPVKIYSKQDPASTQAYLDLIKSLVN
jgi:ribose transport system substrate-binding protein